MSYFHPYTEDCCIPVMSQSITHDRRKITTSQTVASMGSFVNNDVCVTSYLIWPLRFTIVITSYCRDRINSRESHDMVLPSLHLAVMTPISCSTDRPKKGGHWSDKFLTGSVGSEQGATRGEELETGRTYSNILPPLLAVELNPVGIPNAAYSISWSLPIGPAYYSAP